MWITFLATMDEDGYCHFSAIENLALRARVSLKEAENAVKTLMAPDPNSSDPDHEGRRIERVPGGFIVLNAKKHRDMATRVEQREATRLRVAKHRAAHKGEKRTQADLEIEEIFACECCKEPFEKPYQLYVTQDHNHQTGAERGFVCQSCNKIIGLIESNAPTQSKKDGLCRKYILRYAVTDGNESSDSVTPSYTNAVSNTDKTLASPDAKQKRQKAQDHIWDTLLEVCGLSGANPTPSERGAWNKSVQALKAVDATPAEIQARATAYRRKWPQVSLTPTALARRWNECVAGQHNAN